MPRRPASELPLDQLYAKRARDRENQRALRAKKKTAEPPPSVVTAAAAASSPSSLLHLSDFSLALDALFAPPHTPSEPDFMLNQLLANSLRSQNPLWAVTPSFHAPTCPTDQIVLDLIQSETKPAAQPFFPSIKALVNPDPGDDRSISSVIVSHIIGAVRVHTLPEKLALVYVLCNLVRWYISPTQYNYESIPEFLRPTLAQIAIPHPVWVGTIGWPTAREAIIRYMDYTQYPLFAQRLTQSFSINWPYGPDNMIVSVDGQHDYVLNPTFIAHVRQIEHWTAGNALIADFPFLNGCVNVR